MAQHQHMAIRRDHGAGDVSITATEILVPLNAAKAAATALGVLCYDGGVNLSGAEFTPNALPGVLGTDYAFPTLAELTYYANKGMMLVRLPFLWERIQPALGGPLDPAHMAWLTSFAQFTPTMQIVLDAHNYGYYNGQLIGASPGPTEAQFGNLWSQLATAFGGYPNVRFGLMNEPSALSLEIWLTTVNTSIAAIRATGATNLITVPGLDFAGADTWITSDNAGVMIGVADSGKNFLFEVHQYLDIDGSGTSQNAVDSTILSQRLGAVTTWARANNARLFLGEFGIANNSTMLAAMIDGVSFMAQNADVWESWAVWGGGPRWPNSYIYLIEPANLDQANQTDTTQMTALIPYLT